jgi:protein involved in polysaccharide export with SLBB domain
MLSLSFQLKKYYFAKGIAVMLFLSFFSTYSFAQGVPTYLDRAFIITDSSVQKNSENPAFEGSIDEDIYILGPGDVFKISINEIETGIYESTVNPDGTIILPKSGILKVSGLVLKQGKELIRAEIRKRYKSQDIYISLSNVRKIKISVYGEVLKKGSKVVYANSRLSDILMDGGFSPIADIRNIKIISKNGETRFVDMLLYIRLGERAQNILLEEGDYILVDRIDKTVSLSGMVKYPGVYEFRDGETFSDLIKISGGFLDAAFLDSIEVIRFADDNKKQKSIINNVNNFMNEKFILKNKDFIIIRGKSQYLEEKMVSVAGFVKFPGYYKIDDGVTKLSELISIAGGFREDASLRDADVQRTIGVVEYDSEFERIKSIPRKDMTDDEYDYLKSKSRQRKGKVVVDFEQIFVEKTDDLILRKGDQIVVPEKKDYIILIGQAVYPGNIPFKKGLTVRDYINLAGGFGWKAETGKVRVIKSKTGEWIEEDDVKILEPGDTIWIPEEPQPPKFWDIFKDTLAILGQVATVIAATIAVIVSTR